MWVRGLAMAIALLAAASSAAGCASEARYQVAGGAIEPGPWSAWAFRGPNEYKTCLEIVVPKRDSSRVCNLEAADPGSWQPDTPAGESGFVAGNTIDPRAVTAVLALADGSRVEAAVTGAPGVGPMRFFVLVAPPGVSRDHIDLLDAGGTVLTTLPMH
jgi:hypothetical protein